MENTKEENDKIYILGSRKNIDSFINLPAYDKHKMKSFLMPSYNFNFSKKYLYNKILDLIPIPKFIGNDCSNL